MVKFVIKVYGVDIEVHAYAEITRYRGLNDMT